MNFVKLLLQIVGVLGLVSSAALFAGHFRGAEAQDQPDAVSGRVVQGTAGASVPEGLQVVLLTIDGATGQITDRTTQNVDAEGGFAFTNLLSGPDLTYHVAANLPGRYAPSVDLSQTADWSDVTLTIYESTTSLEDIHVNSFVVLVPSIDGPTRTIGVLAVAGIQNKGDRVFQVDLEKPDLTGLDLLRFNLPEGYRDLAVESDLPAGNTMEIPTGFAVTNPVPPTPEGFNILMTYTVKYEGDSFSFPLKLPYGADLVRVMVPDGDNRVSGEGLGAAESVIFNDAVYQAIEGKDLARDTTLNISFTKLPQPSVVQASREFLKGKTYILIIVWVAAVVLLGVLAYALISSRKRKSQSTKEKAASDPVAERRKVVEAIAALDDEHEAGKITEDEYRVRRSDLKQKALKYAAPSPQPEG